MLELDAFMLTSSFVTHAHAVYVYDELDASMLILSFITHARALHVYVDMVLRYSYKPTIKRRKISFSIKRGVQTVYVVVWAKKLNGLKKQVLHPKNRNPRMLFDDGAHVYNLRK